MDADRLQAEYAGWRRLEAEAAALRAELNRLRKILEVKQWEGERQAAPFRKPQPAAPPKKPGRKSGEEHGPHARCAIPSEGKCDCVKMREVLLSEDDST